MDSGQQGSRGGKLTLSGSPSFRNDEMGEAYRHCEERSDEAMTLQLRTRMSRKSKNPHWGSTLDGFLEEEGIYEEATTAAIEKATARQARDRWRCPGAYPALRGEQRRSHFAVQNQIRPEFCVTPNQSSPT